MDSELRLISAILHASPVAQAEFWDKQPPLTLFSLRSTEAHWLYRYREKHGRFPSPELFNNRFDEKVEEHEDPIAASLEPVANNAAFAQIKTIVDQVTKQFDEKLDPSAIIGSFREAAQKLNSFDMAYDDESLSDANIALRRYNQMRANLLKNGNRVVDFPWPAANKLVGFLRPGEVMIISARTSLGKTWALLAIIDHLANKGIDAFLLSKEMPTAQISDRLTALRFGLDWERFRKLDLDISEQVRWKIAARRKPIYPVLVSGEETFQGTGMQQLYAKVQRVKPSVVAVDGAYLLQVEGLSKQANEVQRLTAVSNGLKRMAKVMKVPVIAVIQMNRDAEKKAGIAKGGLSNAYGADAWAQDADFFLEVAGERGTYERVLRFLKGRDTNIGDFFINFKLSPKPDFSQRHSLSAASALGKIPFKVLK